MDERDILISRQVALKAAVDMLRGENSQADGMTVLAWAQDFEDWILRGTQVASAPRDVTPQAPVEQANFNIDECPRHHKSAPSKFNPEQKALFCPADKTCEWGRTDFFNTDDQTGETTRVTKYRLTKAQRWMYPDQFLDMLREEGVLV